MSVRLRSRSPHISSPRSCSSTRCSPSVTPSSSADLSGEWRPEPVGSHRPFRVAQMQAVAQLCDRAILPRRRAMSNATGRAAEIVAEYLQAGYGAGARRVWAARPERHPADDLVRLRSVRVVQDGEDADGRLREAGRHRDPFTGSCTASPLPEDQGVRPAGRRGVQRDGHELAVARSVSDRRARDGPRGFRARFCLNEGLTTVDVSIASLGAPGGSHRRPAGAPLSPSTSRIRRKVTPRAECSPGSGRAWCARCSTGREAEAS